MQLIRVLFRAMLCSVLPLCLLCGALPVSAYTGSAPQGKTDGANLRVMSYNVLVDNDETLGGWSWGQPLGNRGDKASACINYYRPDVIGLQECNYKWHVSLRQNLPDYDFVNPDVPEEQALEKPESLGQKDWMCTTMMYNTKTLTLLHNELIGYSVNYWGCIQRMRYVSMALFEIKESGRKFVFISTHLDAEQDAKGQSIRAIQTEELANCIQRYKDTYQCPIISTGDYNSSFKDEPIQTLVSEARMTASPENRGGIDYILYSQGVTSKYFTVIEDADVAGASDHQPVIADLAVANYTFTTTTTTATAAGTTYKTVVITKEKPTTTTGWENEKVTRPAEDTTTTTTTTTSAVDTESSTANPTTTASSVDEPGETEEPATTTAVEELQKDDSKEEVKQEATAVKKTPPVWTLALAGFGGTAVLGGLAGLIYWLITRKK